MPSFSSSTIGQSFPSPLFTTPASPPQIPLSEKKGCQTFAHLNEIIRRHKLDFKAISDTTGKRTPPLVNKIKPILFHHAANEDGELRIFWKELSLETRSLMCRKLVSKSPWLEKFEQNWAAEFALSRALNTRVANSRRSAAVEREEKRRKELEELTAHSKGKLSYPTLQIVMIHDFRAPTIALH